MNNYKDSIYANAVKANPAPRVLYAIRRDDAAPPTSLVAYAYEVVEL